MGSILAGIWAVMVVIIYFSFIFTLFILFPVPFIIFWMINHFEYKKQRRMEEYQKRQYLESIKL